MSNEYAGLVSESNYEKLQDENKALKEIESHTFVENECLIKENKALKDSRDDLLEAYKEHRWDMCRLGVKEELIQKAQALKEKEA